MKRKVILSIIIVLLAVPAFAQYGTIREMTGLVELKHAGASDFTAARTGEALARDTLISTGFRSNAIVEVGSSLITVRPLTRLSIAELISSSGSETINVSLQTGRVRVDVKPPAGTKTNFTVTAPTATASVRGTSFEFDTHTLTVHEGRVAFYPTRASAQTGQSAAPGQAAGESSQEKSTLEKEGVVVRAGATSEILPGKRVTDSITQPKTVLVPVLKVEIDAGTKKDSIRDLLVPPEKSLKKPGGIDIKFIVG